MSNNGTSPKDFSEADASATQTPTGNSTDAKSATSRVVDMARGSGDSDDDSDGGVLGDSALFNAKGDGVPTQQIQKRYGLHPMPALAVSGLTRMAPGDGIPPVAEVGIGVVGSVVAYAQAGIAGIFPGAGQQRKQKTDRDGDSVEQDSGTDDDEDIIAATEPEDDE